MVPGDLLHRDIQRFLKIPSREEQRRETRAGRLPRPAAPGVRYGIVMRRYEITGGSQVRASELTCLHGHALRRSSGWQCIF